MSPRTLHIIAAVIVASGAIPSAVASIDTHSMPQWVSGVMAIVLALAALVNHIGSAIWPVLTAENLAKVPPDPSAPQASVQPGPLSSPGLQNFGPKP